MENSLLMLSLYNPLCNGKYIFSYSVVIFISSKFWFSVHPPPACPCKFKTMNYFTTFFYNYWNITTHFKIPLPQVKS